MAKNKQKFDVSYYKPPCICKKGTAIVGYQNQYGQWFNLHTNTRPIAYSTKATQGWLDILKKESSSWDEMLNKANGSTGEYMIDYEAVEVIQAYIKYKAPFDSVGFE